MALKVEFDRAAFRHGIAEEDIVWALTNHLADGLLLTEDNADYVAIRVVRKLQFPNNFR